MLERGTLNREYFLKAISKHLGEPKPVGNGDADFYFGEGYWRGNWNEDETGISLINPSKTHEEIRIVEEAIRIIQCIC